MSRKFVNTVFLSRKFVNTAFLSQKFIDTRSSIAFYDLLDSSMAPHIKPHCRRRDFKTSAELWMHCWYVCKYCILSFCYQKVKIQHFSHKNAQIWHFYGENFETARSTLALRDILASATSRPTTPARLFGGQAVWLLTSVWQLLAVAAVVVYCLK